MEIHNLTLEQVQMLDKLWTMETLEEIESFKRELPLFRRQQVDTLMELVRLQSLDDMIDAHDEGDCYPDADILFKKIQDNR
jgi:hypothetical protein